MLLVLGVFSVNPVAVAFSQPTKSNASSSNQTSSPSNEIHTASDSIKTSDTASNTATIATILSTTNNNTANTTSSTSITTNTLIARLLSKNLENHLQQVGSILNVTSKLPQVRNTTYSYLLNETLSTLHGIPQNADIVKRGIAHNILSSNKMLLLVVFILPNGDIYFDEPYSEQKVLTTTNLAFRDYFQGAMNTNDTYLGNVITSVASPVREALIATPVYSLKDNSTTIAGVWAGGINFNILSKELQSFNLTAASGMRAVYVDHNGNKVADSDVGKSSSNPLESFATLTSFKHAAIDGQSGSTIETIGNTKMIVTYQPVKIFHNTWAVLLMQPLSSNQTTATVN